MTVPYSYSSGQTLSCFDTNEKNAYFMNAHMEEGDHHQHTCCSFWWTPATIMPQMPAHSILTHPMPKPKKIAVLMGSQIRLFVIQMWQLTVWERPQVVTKWQQSVKFPLLGRRIWRFGKKKVTSREEERKSTCPGFNPFSTTSEIEQQ